MKSKHLSQSLDLHPMKNLLSTAVHRRHQSPLNDLKLYKMSRGKPQKLAAVHPGEWRFYKLLTQRSKFIASYIIFIPMNNYVLLGVYHIKLQL